MTGLTGTVVSSLRYTPYGATRWSSGPFPTDRRFTGQQEEVTLGVDDDDPREPGRLLHTPIARHCAIIKRSRQLLLTRLIRYYKEYDMGFIVHITSRSDWEAAQGTGEYRADSLNLQGFIYCSTPEQVVEVANGLYRGQTGLVLLVIDPAQLRHEVRYEDCYDTGLLFPHLYGPLNPEAVVAVVDFPPQTDGTFALPAALQELIP